MTTVSTLNNLATFDAIEEFKDSIMICGVTYLTSWSGSDLLDILNYLPSATKSLWEDNMKRAQNVMKGIVCSPVDLEKVAEAELELYGIHKYKKICPGIGMNPEFCGSVIAKISKKTNIKFSETENHFQSQSTIDGIVYASGCVRSFAVSLMKISNDIRWLGSGPRAGIGEINLPEVQPGSSIMPGKVNPVIAESVTMICAQVMGNDQTVSIAGQSGNFELNVMMPIAAHNLLESIEILSNGSKNFSKQCIEGLVATEKGPNMVNQGLAICTALAPKLGYDKAANIAHIASETGKTIKEVTLQETELSSEEIDEILEPLSMTEPK